MNYNVEYFLDYTTKNMENNFNIDKKMLKVLIINRNSDDAIFNYYNFDEYKEVLAFIKYDVLASAALSDIVAEYEEMMHISLDKNEFVEYAKNLKGENLNMSSLDTYKKIYNEIEALEAGAVTFEKVVSVIEDINFIYSQNENIFTSLEFGDNLKTYLKEIYEKYVSIDDNLESLDEALSETDFTLDDFMEVMQEAENVDIEELEEFLYQIPMI